MQQPESGGPGSMGDDGEVLPKFEDVGDAFPQQEECVAILTMKCGEPLMAVRKKLHEEIPVTFIPEEGFGVFQSKVERHFGKIGPNYVQEKRAIYLKPSSNATQSKYVQLSQENFDPLLRMRWKVARSMKVELKYEVFCYFTDITTKKDKKRLSMKMFQPQHQQQQQQQQQQQAQPQQLLPESPSSDMLTNGMGFGPAPSASGGAAGSAAASAAATSAAFPLASAISQVMQGYSDVVPPVLPEVPTKKTRRGSGNADESDRPRKSTRNARPVVEAMEVAPVETEMKQQHQPQPQQLQQQQQQQQPQLQVQQQQQQQQPPQPQPPVFHMIPFRINGFVVPLEVDVTALRRSLGLLQPPVNAADAAVAAAVAAAAVGDLDATPSAHQYDR